MSRKICECDVLKILEKSNVLQTQCEKPVNLKEVKEFIYNKLKEKYGNYVTSKIEDENIIISTKAEYCGCSDVWISLNHVYY